MESFVSLLSTVFAPGLFFLAGKWLDSHATPDAKGKVAAFVLQGKLQAPEIREPMLSLFDTLYGDPLLSFKSLRRSAGLTFATTYVLMLYFFVLSGNSSFSEAPNAYIQVTIQAIWQLSYVIALVSVPADYLALFMIRRAIVGRPPGDLLTAAFATISCVFAISLPLLLYSLVGLSVRIVGFVFLGDNTSWLPSMDQVYRGFGIAFLEPRGHNPSPNLAILLAAVVTTCWIWVLVVGLVLGRTLLLIDQGRRVLKKIIDVEKCPFELIGIVLAALTFAIHALYQAR
jgi:hypothetical protein